MTERNVELLEKTMQYVLDHPEKHYQGDYWDTCNSTGCFCGWAIHLSGSANFWVDTVDDLLYRADDDDSISWHSGGQEALGLTWAEANLLFDCGNTRPMLELMVKDLVNGDELRSSEDYRQLAGEAS